MLKSKILQPEAYDRFIEFNYQNDGARVDRAYLERATIRVFFYPNTPDRWVASYVINTKAPFRCLSVLNDAMRTRLLASCGISQTNLTEITLLSRDRSFRWTAPEREYYYATSLVDALRAGRQFILGGTVEEKLVPMQMEFLNRLLYQGELDFFGKPVQGWLFYASWFGVLRNSIRRGIRVWLKRPNRPSAKPQPTATGKIPTT